MEFAFRALPVWPYPRTRNRRGRYAFQAPWSNTLRLLDAELRHLEGRNCVIGAGFRERDLRLDGLPRSAARDPDHPGIELSFDTRRHGRLVYKTDACERWEHNVRSIALGLEALRAVDRYGITLSGEQYAGWRQLAPGNSSPQPSAERGLQLIAEYGAERDALKATHPDTGGATASAVDFQSVRLAQALRSPS